MWRVFPGRHTLVMLPCDHITDSGFPQSMVLEAILKIGQCFHNIPDKYRPCFKHYSFVACNWVYSNCKIPWVSCLPVKTSTFAIGVCCFPAFPESRVSWCPSGESSAVRLARKPCKTDVLIKLAADHKIGISQRRSARLSSFLFHRATLQG